MLLNKEDNSTFVLVIVVMVMELCSVKLTVSDI